MENGLLLIGKIVSTHGIHGKLRVYSYAESWMTFSALNSLYIQDEKGDTREYRLIHIEPHKNVLLLELGGISSLDEAERLVGASVLMEKDVLSPLPDGEYYWLDVIGLRVFTDDGVFLGEVKRIIQTGSNDVYVVCDEEREYLIPSIEDVVIKIDIPDKKMIIHPMEGLL